MRIKYKYTYSIYPDCPKATEYSRERSETTARMTMCTGMLGFFSVLAYVAFSIVFLEEWEEGYFIGWLLSAIFVTFFSFLLFYLMVCRNYSTESEIEIILLKSKFGRDYEDVLDEEIKKIRYINRKENATRIKHFFVWYSLILSGITAAIAFFTSIYLLCEEGYGAGMLVISLLSVFVAGYGIYRLRKKSNVSIKTVKETTPMDIKENKTNNDDVYFCSRCGKEVSLDSLFCSACGNKVR